MFSTEKSGDKSRTILLTVALLLSAIAMVPSTASAEDERLDVYVDAYSGNLHINIWIENADHESNYGVVWAITDENNNLTDGGALYYNGSDEHPGEPGWWFDMEISDYVMGEYYFFAELYDDSDCSNGCSMLDDYEDSFWVSPWLGIEVPYHTEDEGNVTAFFTSGGVDPNSTHRLEWTLYDPENHDPLANGSISGSEGNLTLYLGKGQYYLQAILYQHYDDGNHSYWEHIDSEWREIYVGSEYMQLYADYHNGQFFVNAWVQFPDENTTSYYVVWNITNSTGAEVDNGSEEMWEHEHYADFNIWAPYPEGTYTFNIELYANQTNVVLDSQSRNLSIWPQLVLNTSTYYLEEAGNVTIEFFVAGMNLTHHEYLIEWYVYEDGEGTYGLNDSHFFGSGGNFTLYLEDGDYNIQGELYTNRSYGNNWTGWDYLDHSSLNIHVGGASLADVWFNCCWHEYDENDNYVSMGSFDAYVGWANYSSTYTIDWTIEDENGVTVMDGTAYPEHEGDHWFWENFELELPLGDYTVIFLLYEDNQLADTRTTYFQVYPDVRLVMDNEWTDGSYVHASYFVNGYNGDYTLEWHLRDENWDDVDSESFVSDDLNGVLEFFNLSAGEYYLEISLDYSNSGHNFSHTLWDDRWFWVENDPEMNRAPSCELSDGIAVGSNIDAAVGEDFTFSADCSDMDGDAMTISVAVDHPSLSAPFLFDQETGNTSTWTYNLSETGLYGFGLTVEDGNGGKRAYAFTVMASGNDTNTNNTNATTEEEILEEIESGGLPSVSLLVSVVAIALIALRRRN